MTQATDFVNETILNGFFKKLSLHKRSLLITDYDGTLAPFNVHRQQAMPYPGMYEKLRNIDFPPSRVIILTGRNLLELTTMLSWLNFPEIWGSYGIERLYSKDRYEKDDLDLNQIRGLRIAQEKHPELIKSGVFEVKPFSLALHWREMNDRMRTELTNKIYKEWEEITYDYHLEIIHFDGGIELKPKNRNKREAMNQILKNVPSDTVIAYLGDDLTDELAFEALGPRGLKVLVREQNRINTKADLRINPGSEVLHFFDRWIKSIQE